MKISIFALPLVLMFLLNSCVTTQTYTKEEKKMKIDNESVFVVKNGGKKITGKKIKVSLRTSSIKIDDQEININDLIAYQDKAAYYAKFTTDEKNTWVKQLKRGKINLYYYEIYTYKKIYNGTKSVSDNKNDTHFVFNKGKGQLLELNITDIAKLLKDNKDAYNKFTSTFGEKDRILLPKQLQNHPKVIFEAIDIYNGDM